MARLVKRERDVAVTVSTDRVRPDGADLSRLWFERRWTTLRALNPVTAHHRMQYRPVDEPTYVELFTSSDDGVNVCSRTRWSRNSVAR